MPKLILGKDGVVVNIVNAPDDAYPSTHTEWLVPDDYVVSVGDEFDGKDPAIDDADVVAMKIAYRHENYLRQLNRAFRASSTAANTAANAAGLPSAANSGDVTVAQFRGYIKTLL
jgi:hypothetical protein